MKLTRYVLSAGIIAIATCTIEPGVVLSVVPIGVARALADPLTLFEQRSPGARNDGTTIDIKRRRDRGGLAADAAPTSTRGGGSSPGAVPGKPDLFGGDGTGPLALVGDGPILPRVSGDDEADGAARDSGDGEGPGFPGFVGGGGGGGGYSSGGSGGGGGAGGGGGGGSGSTPPPVGPGGPGVPAPEPATWILLILGFSITGTAMRRIRRSAARACE